MDKKVATAAEAVSDIPDSIMLATGGFGICGIPSALLAALAELGSRDITLVSNNCGIAGVGNSLLLEKRQIRRLIASYVGENKELERQYLSGGEVEIELNPPQARWPSGCAPGGARVSRPSTPAAEWVPRSQTVACPFGTRRTGRWPSPRLPNR